MSVDLLEMQIKTGKFVNLYVLYGEEDYMKSFYCKRITDKAVTAYENFNLQRYDGTPDMAQLAAAVNNLPLMSERKCIVLRDTDPQGLKAGDWKELQAILKALPQECIMIFLFDAVKPNPKKDARFKSLLTLAQKNGLAVEIKALAHRDLQRFIAKHVRAAGCEIDAETADYLIETCGPGLNNLACELEKVCARAGGGATAHAQIAREHIDAVAIRPMTSSIYDLARAVIAGQLDKGMRIVDELFYKKEEPVIILSALSGAFCDLYRAAATVQAGVGDARVIADFNYRGREFRIRNAMRDCRGADLPFLADCLNLLMLADRRIKSTRADKRIVIEQLLTQIGQARNSANKGKSGFAGGSGAF